MKIFAVLGLCVLAVVCWQGVAYSYCGLESGVATSYFSARGEFEYTIAKACGDWRHWVQAFRAVKANPNARRVLSAHPVNAMWGPYTDLYGLLGRRGITQAQIARQPTYVYILQLGAFQSSRSVRSFLRACHATASDLVEGEDWTGIYTKVPKTFVIWSASEIIPLPKSDPLYLVTYGGLTRIRYGVYENTADAGKDAAEWRRRFGVKAIPVRVPLTPSLVDSVLYGTVPGAYDRSKD